jgi:hypothetical protein
MPTSFPRDNQHPRVSFRVFSRAARNACVAACESNSRGICCSFRVLRPPRYRRLLVLRSRCAVGPYPGCAVFPRRTDWQAVRRTSDILSSSLAFLQSVAQRTLAGRPQPPAPLVDFGSLQHMQGSAIYRPRTFQSPLRSAFRVWLPSWRVSLAETGPALFRAGGARGIRPSELSPPMRWRRVSAPSAPACRFSRGLFTFAEAKGRPRRPRLPGFDPRSESLAPCE